MQIAENIKKAREAKRLSRKEVAIILNMDQSQYSKIENGKVGPQFSTIEKIAKVIKMNVVDLVSAPDLFKEVAAYDKTHVEKSGWWTSLKNWKKNPSFLSLMAWLLNKN